jgi:hypothetical protein
MQSSGNASTDWYVLVRTGTYRYRHQPHTRFILKLLQPLSDAYESLLNAWLVPRAQRFLQGSLFHSETTQAGRAAPKHLEPSVDLIHIAAAVSALPTGKPDPLCLLNRCGIVAVGLPARKKGMRGTLPTILATGATTSSIYQYIAVCMYQYILVYTVDMPLCMVDTSTYWYIPVHTCSYFIYASTYCILQSLYLAMVQRNTCNN